LLIELIHCISLIFFFFKEIRYYSFYCLDHSGFNPFASSEEEFKRLYSLFNGINANKFIKKWKCKKQQNGKELFWCFQINIGSYGDFAIFRALCTMKNCNRSRRGWCQIEAWFMALSNPEFFKLLSSRFATITTLAEGHCLILKILSLRVVHFAFKEIQD